MTQRPAKPQFCITTWPDGKGIAYFCNARIEPDAEFFTVDVNFRGMFPGDPDAYRNDTAHAMDDLIIRVCVDVKEARMSLDVRCQVFGSLREDQLEERWKMVKKMTQKIDKAYLNRGSFFSMDTAKQEVDAFFDAMGVQYRVDYRIGKDAEVMKRGNVAQEMVERIKAAMPVLPKMPA